MKPQKMAPEAVKMLRSLSGIEKDALCWRIGIKRGWLNNIISQGRGPSPILALRIEDATHGKIKREWLCPNIDWELVGDYTPLTSPKGKKLSQP